MRRSVTPLAVVALAALAACREAAPPRNLLLITLDTLRADHLGFHGYPRPTSPRLDAFADRAVVFEDALCSMPTTLPSHVSMFTGLRPVQHGIRANGETPRRDLVTLFDLLAERGAATAAVVGSRVVDAPYLAGMGFAEVAFPGNARQYQVRGAAVTERARAWLADHGSRPFGLWVHYYDTHEPYTPPAAQLAAFARPYSGALGDRLSVRDLVALNDPQRAAALTPQDLQHIADLYDAEIAYLDAQVGALLEFLDAAGLTESTLVAVVGDHGQALGERGFFGHGLRLLEPVIRVPFVLRVPGVEPRRVTTPVETVDLLPTLADYMGLESPQGLPGRSLRPLAAGAKPARARVRVVERRSFRDQPWLLGAALHGGDWKAVYYRDEDGSEARLLTRGSDLDEPTPSAAMAREARWLEAVVAGLRDTTVDSASEHDAETERMLRALGYLDGGTRDAPSVE